MKYVENYYPAHYLGIGREALVRATSSLSLITPRAKEGGCPPYCPPHCTLAQRSPRAGWGGPWRGHGTELLSRGERQAGGGCSPRLPAVPEPRWLQGAAAAPSDSPLCLMWKMVSLGRRDTRTTSWGVQAGTGIASPSGFAWGCCLGCTCGTSLLCFACSGRCGRSADSSSDTD